MTGYELGKSLINRGWEGVSMGASDRQPFLVSPRAEIADLFKHTGLLSETLEERGQTPAGEAFYETVIDWKEESDGVRFWLGRKSNALDHAPQQVLFSIREVTSTAIELSSKIIDGEEARPMQAKSPAQRGSFQVKNWRIDWEGMPFAFQVSPVSGLGEDLVPRQGLASPADDLNVGSSHQSAAVRFSNGCLGLSLSFDESDLIYGFGETFGPLVKNGTRLSVINSDSLGNHGRTYYQSLPFGFTSRGMCFEVIGDAPFELDCGHDRHGVITFRQPARTFGLRCSWDVNLGSAVTHLRQRVGRIRSSPEWSFGLWMSRCFYKDELEVREVLKKAKENEVKVSVVNLDARCWMRPDFRTDFVPDSDRFPDFFGFVNELVRDGIEVCLWENPYVSSISELYKEGLSKGYFAKTASGEVYPYFWVPQGLEGFPVVPQAGLVDFTNPAACEWWMSLHEPLLKAGVKCFKTDFGEEIPADAIFFSGQSGLEIRNTYSDLYNLCVTDAVERIHGDQGLIWARSGYRQTQSTPVKWAGDGQTNWRSLRATLRAGLSQSFGGAIFWSHDVGGFYGPLPDPELYLRWAQMAMWGSHVRLHGTTPREPWEFGESVLQKFRLALAVRELLRPYFTEGFEKCVQQGSSFVRPLVFESPRNLALRGIDDTFMAGGDVVVAPFLSPWSGRSIWLPPGEWADLRNGAIVSGDAQVESLRTDFLPVFYRSDSSYFRLFQKATALISKLSGR